MQAFFYDSLIFGFLALDLGVIIVFIIQFSRVGRKILTTIPIILFIFLLLSGGVVVYGSFIEPWRISVTEYSLKTVMPFLPKDTDLKIALISDFHLGPYKGKRFVEKTVEKLQELDPDLIFIAGDFLFVDDINKVPEAMEGFSPLLDLSPPLGIYAVLGNHDYGELLPEIAGVEGKNRAGLITHALEKVGVRVLVNQSTIITKNGIPLFELGGLKEIWTGGADIKGTFSGSLPRVLLVHNPDAVLLDDICDVSLVLAGHTHAGQIRLPYWGSIPQIPDKLGKKYDQGYFSYPLNCKDKGLRPLLITRGIGESGPRARLFAPPEIVIIH